MTDKLDKPELRLVPKAELERGDVRYWQIMGKYRELGARNRRSEFRLIQGDTSGLDLKGVAS